MDNTTKHLFYVISPLFQERVTSQSPRIL